MSFVTFSFIQLYKVVKLSNQLGTRFVILVHRIRADMSFVTFLLIPYNKPQKRSNQLKTRFVTLVHRIRNFAHTVVLGRKTVKSSSNTICDTCAQNSRRYEFCDIFAHTV